MKNLVCPVSPDRVLEAQPRISALLVVALLGLYLFTQLWLIPVFLLVDFLLRGYMNGKFSVVAYVSMKLAIRYYADGLKIDKAPKMFAARLGMVFSALIIVLSVFNLTSWALGLAFALMIFASVECFLNFCVGCYVYTLFIIPMLKSY
nr:DUF4395 family protein [uncultured Carboxylicivirga sp.]